METILKIMGAALGLLVPILLVWLLNQGIKKAELAEQRRKVIRNRVLIGVSLWTLVIWTLSLSHVLKYQPGDTIPRFVVSLVLSVGIGLGLLTNKDFRTILDSTPLKFIVGVQTFRLAGFAFLIIAGLGILPSSFQSAGYGDIATGTLAILSAMTLAKGSKSSKVFFWGFNLAGMFDLLNVAFMLLYYYPIWYKASPSSASATDFSLVMIPAIAAPIALILHVYSIRNYILIRS